MLEWGVPVVLAVWVVAFCAGGWATHALLMMYATRVIPRLEDEAPDLSDWPSLCVIVPACNEAETLEPALQTLLAQDYPRLQIILVDDRSTDGTGAIVDRLAEGDDRVQPVHVTALPDGWLGKVHALEHGVRSSASDWVLFTDADVHFEPAALRRAVAFAVRRERDFVTALPQVLSQGLLLHATLLALGELMGVAAKIWEIGRPGSKAFAGVGPFNLVRRAFYDTTPGLQWLRMEVSEDLGIGLLMQRHGARVAMLSGRNVLLWRWYGSLGEMVRGLEKNIFSLSGFNYAKTVFFAVLLWLTVLAPAAAWLPGAPGWLTWVAVAALALHVVYGVRYAWWLRLNPLGGVLIPVGKLVVSFILLNSAVQTWRRRGVHWRGTHYSLDELRDGHRVRRQ